MNETAFDRDCDTADETGDMVVFTLAVPRGRRHELSVTVSDRTVTVTAPGGFWHELVLPPDAQAARLHAQLYGAFLELRAPRGPQSEPSQRSVPVRVLR